VSRTFTPAGSPAVHRRPAGLGVKGVVATVLGNAIEFYDFTSYAAFATQIGNAFFPSGSAFVSLLASVTLFGAGFLTRPLGGLLIGAYADRAGRRPAMTLTIVMMALGSFMIAIIPSYATIGLAAPLLVVIARLIQGFALGGEVGPSTAYLLEAAPRRWRTFYGSWQSSSQNIASLVAGALGFALAQGLAPGQLDEWGWRVPFALGVLALPVGLYIRRRLEETLDHRRAHKSARHIIVQTATAHWGPIIAGIVAVAGATIATYVNLYMTTYAQQTLGMPVGKSMLATLTVGAVGIGAAIAGGWLADRIGRRWVMVAPRLALGLLVIPAFFYLNEARSVTALLTMTGLFTLLNSFSAGSVIVQVTDSFPQAVRSTATAAAYALSVAVFGGSTQAVVTWLISVTQDPVAPAYYVAAVSIPSAIAAWMMRSAAEDA